MIKIGDLDWRKTCGTARRADQLNLYTTHDASLDEEGSGESLADRLDCLSMSSEATDMVSVKNKTKNEIRLVIP